MQLIPLELVLPEKKFFNNCHLSLFLIPGHSANIQVLMEASLYGAWCKYRDTVRNKNTLDLKRSSSKENILWIEIPCYYRLLYTACVAEE